MLLFITEKVRMDIVGLFVMVSLAILGLVTPAEALSGFSSPAVVTVWAVLILSAGLSRTGVATILGSWLLRLAGTHEARLVFVIMMTTGILSGFMNDIGVVSLMLPVVVDVAKRTGTPPSKLLMPLAFAALLGGVITLIGTPPNILVSEALLAYGLEPFGMFDFAPTGIVALLTGVLFMTFIGRRILTSRDIEKETLSKKPGNFENFFGLSERLFAVNLPADSALAGKTLAQSRLGSILGINVIAIIRNGQMRLAPEPHFVLNPGDRLVVGGRLERMTQISGKHQLVVEDESLPAEWLTSEEIEFAEVGLSPRSSLLGMSLGEIGFRHKYGLNVLAIWRDGAPKRTNLQNIHLLQSDILLVQGQRPQLQNLADDPNFLISSSDQAEIYHLHERLLAVKLPLESDLAGKTLAESRLGEAYGFTVLGIVREGTPLLMPTPDEQLLAGDTLFVEGKPEDLDTLRGLQELEYEPTLDMDVTQFETEQVGLTEVVVSPHSSLPGKTLRNIHFREKYGLSVLAIWREGRAYRSFLRDMAFKYGDALLVFGARERLKILGADPEFLVLTQEALEVPRKKKMPIAILVMGFVLFSVVMEWIPIAIAAVMGVVLMILSGCLTPDEAYRAIHWKAIFLIAGMLPLGIAMEKTGTASFIADGMIGLIGGLGPPAVTAGLFLLAAVTSQVMPNPAVAVLLAPIALNTANDLGVSPYPLMMALAISASAAFLSPVGHSANVLIMGPGGYRFSDFTKVGVPLTILLLIVTLFILPIIWPYYPG